MTFRKTEQLARVLALVVLSPLLPFPIYARATNHGTVRKLLPYPTGDEEEDDILTCADTLDPTKASQENIGCFKAIRGDIVHFISSPYESPDLLEDTTWGRESVAFADTLEYAPGGLLLLRRIERATPPLAPQDKHLYVIEKIFQSSQLGDIFPQDPDLIDKLQVDDMRPGIVMPGFLDLHVHATQEDIVASFGASLLRWLQDYTLPSENLEAESARYGREMMRLFVLDLLRSGTTTPVAFTTYNMTVPDLLFEEAEKMNMAILTGAQGQDNYNEDNFVKSTQQLYAKWHGRGRALYCVTLRFAPGSTFQQMQQARELLDQNPDAYFMTHLAETYDETHMATLLYQPNGIPQGLPPDHAGVPENLTYLELYDHFGLVRNKKSIMGHSIHLSASDFELMAERGGIIAHCPTSNNFLGSGLMNLGAAIRHKVNFGLGSDVGGGTHLCQLQTMGAMYVVGMLQNTWLTGMTPTGLEPKSMCVTTNCPSSDVNNATCSETQPNLTVKAANNGAKMCYPLPPGGDNPHQYYTPRADAGVPPSNLRVHPALAYYSATLGASTALGLEDKLGSFAPGSDADIVVLNPFGFYDTARRTRFLNTTSYDSVEYLWQRLFVLMTTGNHDTIGATYVAGNPEWVNTDNPLNPADTLCVLPPNPDYPKDYEKVAECSTKIARD